MNEQELKEAVEQVEIINIKFQSKELKDLVSLAQQYLAIEEFPEEKNTDESLISKMSTMQMTEYYSEIRGFNQALALCKLAYLKKEGLLK